ncbi:MAG: carbohydrate kinase family protein [Anaerolineae bacterium]|nr:carbohydrate kinase family protein [Anaerolineae bacterium]
MAFDRDFVGVGGLAYDLVLRVDRLPIADDKYPARLVGKLPGGFIANATCAAARLGLSTGYLGSVGDDDEANMLRQDFARWGVDRAGLLSVAGEPTPFTVVLVDEQGQRAILLPASPLYHLPLDTAQLTIARRARIVYTFPRDMDWCEQLRSAARDSGGLFALDVENAVPLRGAALRTVIQAADVVFLTDASRKTHDLPPIHELAQADQWVIETAGGRGAYGIAGGESEPVFAPAHEVPVVDTTGAGDCFHAALLAAKLDGAPVIEALRFANAAAAIKVQHEGARGGLPTRAEVEHLSGRSKH